MLCINAAIEKNYEIICLHSSKSLQLLIITAFEDPRPYYVEKWVNLLL